VLGQLVVLNKYWKIKFIRLGTQTAGLAAGGFIPGVPNCYNQQQKNIMEQLGHQFLRLQQDG
jgi:hypothetical protein